MSSPVLTVMTAAVRKAARTLQRDYGELANLQVSQKAPGDYVTAADKRCDKILREELAKVRPGYSFLTEETGSVPGTDPDQFRRARAESNHSESDEQRSDTEP